MLFDQIYGNYELTFDHLISIIFSLSLFFLEKPTVVCAIIIRESKMIVSHATGVSQQAQNRCAKSIHVSPSFIELLNALSFMSEEPVDNNPETYNIKHRENLAFTFIFYNLNLKEYKNIFSQNVKSKCNELLIIIQFSKLF